MAQATIETRVDNLEHNGQDVERRVTYMEQTVIPKIHDELRDFRIEFRTGLGDVRQTLGEHSNVLGEHTKTLGEHTILLNEHTKILGEHTILLNEHTKILGEHTVLLNGLSKAVNGLSKASDEQGKMLKVIIELLGTK